MRMRFMLLCGLLLCLVLPGLASAHTNLETATPAQDAVLKSAPAKVTLIFSEELKSGSTGSVVDAAGKRVDAGDGTIDLTDLDHKTLVIPLKAGLGDGVYTVKFSAIDAEDDDVNESNYTFTVRSSSTTPDPTPNPTPVAPLPTAGSAPSSGSAGLLVALLGLALVVVGIGVRLQRRPARG
jgi:methionine-rich copper-binding protein CopC